MLNPVSGLSTSKRFSGMGSGEQCLVPCKLLPTWYDRNASPMIVTLVAFFHFAVIKNQTLTPSVAFTSVRVTTSGCISLTDENHCRSLVSVTHDVNEFGVNWISPVFSEMKFALNALPETLINMLQVLLPMTLRLIASFFLAVLCFSPTHRKVSSCG
jgi:hypothetical protein